MWNIFFQNSVVYYLFFYFFVIFKIFRLSVLANKFWKFLCFFILWIRDFIKEIWKIMEYFSKNYRHLTSKILNKFHHLLFVLYFFIFSAFWYSFFPISPIQTCQKILNIFVVLYCTDYRIYRRIFFKKIRDTLNTNIFRIPSFTICFFNFLVLLTSFFFSIFTCLWFSKNCKIFVLFYCMDQRFY